MNRRLMQTNPFTQVGLMAIVLSFTAVACVAQRAAVSDAQVSSTAQPVEAEVLIYTDNSPGSILFAKAEQEAIRRHGMAVEVVTDEKTFIEALSETMWREVIVVARYERGEPSYAAALREYMRTDEGEGPLAQQYLRDIRVRFYYWYDNSASPAADVPGTFILAPALVQDWLPFGGTSIAYLGGGSDAPEYSIVPGYAFAMFNRILKDSPKRYKEPAMRPLEPGVYTAKVARESGSSTGNGGGNDSECSASLFTDMGGCREAHNEYQDACRDAYGPTWDGGGEKPHPMDKLLGAAALADVGCRIHALGKLVSCDLMKKVKRLQSPGGG